MKISPPQFSARAEGRSSSSDGRTGGGRRQSRSFEQGELAVIQVVAKDLSGLKFVHSAVEIQCLSAQRGGNGGMRAQMSQLNQHVLFHSRRQAGGRRERGPASPEPLPPNQSQKLAVYISKGARSPLAS